MSHQQDYEYAESTYGSSSFEQIRSQDHKKRRQPQGRRRGKAPQSFNGMHRRRRKKVAW